MDSRTRQGHMTHLKGCMHIFQFARNKAVEMLGG
jgi:hypothetical protein